MVDFHELQERLHPPAAPFLEDEILVIDERARLSPSAAVEEKLTIALEPTESNEASHLNDVHRRIGVSERAGARQTKLRPR